MPQIRLTTPTVFPLTVAEVRDHLRKDGTALDTVFDSLIKAVTARVESKFRLQIVKAKWEYRFSNKVEGMDLPLPVVDHSTVVIKYFDAEDQEQEISTSSYELIKHRLTSKIFWNRDLYLNLSKNKKYPIKVEFEAGYPVEGEIAKVPEDVKLYLKVLIGNAFISPEGVADARFDDVLHNYRAYLGDHLRRYIP